MFCDSLCQFSWLKLFRQTLNPKSLADDGVPSPGKITVRTKRICEERAQIWLPCNAIVAGSVTEPRVAAMNEPYVYIYSIYIFFCCCVKESYITRSVGVKTTSFSGRGHLAAVASAVRSLTGRGGVGIIPRASGSCLSGSRISSCWFFFLATSDLALSAVWDTTPSFLPPSPFTSTARWLG